MQHAGIWLNVCGAHTQSLYAHTCHYEEQAHTHACKKQEPKLQKLHFIISHCLGHGTLLIFFG